MLLIVHDGSGTNLGDFKADMAEKYGEVDEPTPLTVDQEFLPQFLNAAQGKKYTTIILMKGIDEDAARESIKEYAPGAKIEVQES
jgi:hypothetical protein